MPPADKAGAQLGEISRPIVFADRLDHLDRGDAVEAPVERRDNPASRRSARPRSQRRLQAAPGIGKLLGRKRDAADASRRERRISRSASAPQPQPISRTRSPPRSASRSADAVELSLLAPVSSVSSVAAIQRRRIIHAGVEPRREELIAEIVMRGDVAAAAAPRIGAQRMADAIAARSSASRHLLGGVESWLVAHAELEQLREIGRRPVAVDIASANHGSSPIEQKPPHATPALHRYRGVGTGLGCRGARSPRRSARQAAAAPPVLPELSQPSTRDRARRSRIVLRGVA